MQCTSTVSDRPKAEQPERELGGGSWEVGDLLRPAGMCQLAVSSVLLCQEATGNALKLPFSHLLLLLALLPLPPPPLFHTHTHSHTVAAVARPVLVQL